MNMAANQLLELMVGQLWQVTILCVIAGWLSKTILRNQPVLAYQLWIIVMFKSVTPPLWASHCGVFSWLFQGLTTASAAAVKFGFGSSLTQEQVVFGLVAVWGAGAVLSLVSVGVKWIRIKHRIESSAIEPPSEVQNRITKLASRLGIRRKVRFVLTSEPIGPAVVGVRKPLIVLPEAVLGGKFANEIEPILAHELLHVKRGDTLVALLETLVRAVWWFHPSVHQAADAMSQSGELCCDQDVLDELSYNPRQYADSLIHVIEARSQLQPLLGQPGVRQEQVTRTRLRRIMTWDYVRPSWPLRLGLLLLSILIVLPGRSLG